MTLKTLNIDFPFIVSQSDTDSVTVLVWSKLKKSTLPQRTVLKYFALFKDVAHSLEPGETTSNSASHQAPNYVQRSKI